MAYMRSIFLMKNKNLFKMDSIDVVKFSQSLGLVIAPRIRFMQQKPQKQKEETSESDEDENGKEMTRKEKKAKNKKKNLELKRLAKEKDNLDFNPFGEKKDFEDDDTLFTVKRVFNASKFVNDSENDEELNHKNKIKLKSKASIVKQIKKKKIQVNEKIQFDEDGNVRKIFKVL